MSKQHLEKFNSRPLSWSSLSSWEWNKEEWASKYLDGEPTVPNEQMIFGSKVGGKLEHDPTYLPQITRQSKMEQEFKVNIGSIEIVGYADTFCDKTFKKLGEYKTSKPGWTQKKVDNHGQITAYCLMNYITNKIKPEDMDIELVWMATKVKETGDFKTKVSFVEPIEDNIHVFKTKRTMVDILKFAAQTKKTYKEMEKFALAYKC